MDDISLLRALLLEWYEMFAPVRRDGTEGAILIDKTAKALGLDEPEAA